jgi:signal transduction histidine kinase
MRPRLLNASAPRALFEAWVVGLLLTAPLLALFPELSGRLVQQGMFFVAAIAALWLALRWRLPATGWRNTLAQSLGVGLLFGGVNALAFQLTTGWLEQAAVRYAAEPPNTGSLYTLIFLLSPGVAFLSFRVAVHIARVWWRFQRRRLLWSIVQDHLLVAVVVQLLFIIPSVLHNVSSATLTNLIEPAASPQASLAARLIAGILPPLSIFSVLIVLVVIAVLPLTAIASYLVARRTTRRLRTLTAATAALRAGDYSARVQVVGADEVAALQTDFNAMAADLAANVHALQAEREAVDALLKSRRDLVAGVSHELRTPVTILRSQLEIALEREAQDAISQADLKLIQDEVTRLQTLIDDLFALSRAEVQALDIRFSAVDVAAVAEGVVQAVAPIARRNQHVEIVTDLPADLPLAQADPARLEQVLRNLINNAVRHAAPGGLVAIKAFEDDEVVLLEVSDTGSGIAPEHLPHIWERYFHADAGGSGLGLALVKSLVEAMGGTVGVVSRVDEGSTFTVCLAVAAEGP